MDHQFIPTCVGPQTVTADVQCSATNYKLARCRLKIPRQGAPKAVTVGAWSGQMAESGGGFAQYIKETILGTILLLSVHKLSVGAWVTKFGALASLPRHPLNAVLYEPHQCVTFRYSGPLSLKGTLYRSRCWCNCPAIMPRLEIKAWQPNTDNFGTSLLEPAPFFDFLQCAQYNIPE